MNRTNQLQQALANLNAQKEKARLDLQQFDGWFAKRKQDAEQKISEIVKLHDSNFKENLEMLDNINKNMESQNSYIEKHENLI